MKSRRDALKALAVTAAAPSLMAQSQHQHPAESLLQISAAQRKPKFFTPGEIELLNTLTDIIIPRSDTPGAADAGVPLLLDLDAANKAALGERWRSELAFAKDELKKYDSPLAMITAFSKEEDTHGARLFRMLKDATIDIYYSTREGLVTELGWHGNTFLAEFKGCTHKEHQS